MTATSFGPQLRRWRDARRVSQLDLALSADVSQRHVSFLETGRSRPSREMVLHLADVLDVPLRDRNAMLVAAGFAPAFAERGLDDATMAQIKHVLQVVLHAYEPFPAYVVDRHWNLVLANDAANRLTTLVGDVAAAAEASGGNVLRLVLHPDGLRPLIVNWERTAAALLHRLELELTHDPADDGLRELVEEVRTLPGVGQLTAGTGEPGPEELLVPMHLRAGDHELRMFTTIATIGAPYDITLEELRIESLLPADEETERALRELAVGARSARP